MLLFGFSVLAVLLCGDVFSGAIGTSDADREKDVEKYGIYSSYCQKSRNNSISWSPSTLGDLKYPPTPVECCNKPKMRCKNYVNPGEMKFGLRNTDSWPIRECTCERQLFKCISKVLSPYDASRAQNMLNPERCFKITKCDSQSKLPCTPEYKEMTVYYSEYLETQAVMRAIVRTHKLKNYAPIQYLCTLFELSRFYLLPSLLAFLWPFLCRRFAS